MKYTEKLQRSIKKNKSNLVVGLDTDIKKIPIFFRQYPDPVFEFNKLIIGLTKDLVAGYKLNMAFYECLGVVGIMGIQKTLSEIPETSIKICDAKRGDIENTSEMYAKTYFDKYDFDAVTLSPYMGKDSLDPFLKRKESFIYVLALTSNPGFIDFQKLKVGKKFLYESVIEKTMKWSKYKNVGFVFGANHLKEINKFSKSKKDIPILIPGIGAQKNDLSRLIKNLNNKNFLINASRSIIYSTAVDATEEEFIKTVRETTYNLNNEINEELKK